MYDVDDDDDDTDDDNDTNEHHIALLKPNSITLASLELAPNMFEAGSCQIPLHQLVRI